MNTYRKNICWCNCNGIKNSEMEMANCVLTATIVQLMYKNVINTSVQSLNVELTS